MISLEPAVLKRNRLQLLSALKLKLKLKLNTVFGIRIQNTVCGSVSDPDPHKEMPLGSGFTWTDADPDPGGKKAKEMYRFIR